MVTPTRILVATAGSHPGGGGVLLPSRGFGLRHLRTFFFLLMALLHLTCYWVGAAGGERGGRGAGGSTGGGGGGWEGRVTLGLKVRVVLLGGEEEAEVDKFALAAYLKEVLPTRQVKVLQGVLSSSSDAMSVLYKLTYEVSKASPELVSRYVDALVEGGEMHTPVQEKRDIGTGGGVVSPVDATADPVVAAGGGGEGATIDPKEAEEPAAGLTGLAELDAMIAAAGGGESGSEEVEGKEAAVAVEASRRRRRLLSREGPQTETPTDTEGEYAGMLLCSVVKVSSLLEDIALEATAAAGPAGHGAAGAKEGLFGAGEVVVLVASPDRRELHARVRRRAAREGREGGKGEGDETNAALPELAYRFSEPRSAAHAPLETPPVTDQASETESAKPVHGKEGGGGASSRCAQAWIGQGRVLLLDLGAEACEFGALLDPGGSVLEGRYPERVGGGRGERPLPAAVYQQQQQQEQEQPLRPLWAKSSPRPTDSEEANPHQSLAVFQAKLSSVLVSAIRTVLVPDLPAVLSPPPRRLLLVPIVVLRDSSAAAVGDTPQEVVRVDAVRGAMKAVAGAGQQVVVLSASHSLQDHPQIAVALARSISSRSKRHSAPSATTTTTGSLPPLSPSAAFRSRQESFVDSAELLYAMETAGDTLASQLLNDARGASSSSSSSEGWGGRGGGPDPLLWLDLAGEAGKAPEELLGVDGGRGQDVKVLPVFVFSLGGAHSGLLAGMHRSSHGPLYKANVGGAGGTGGGRAVYDDDLGDLPRLFQDDTAVAAPPGSDAVLVLQSDSSSGPVRIPFFESGQQLATAVEDATSSVVSGLLSAVCGASPPHQWWSPAHGGGGRWALDLTWAHGFHPFSPFGWGVGAPPSAAFLDEGQGGQGQGQGQGQREGQSPLSSLTVEVCRRNVVLSRMEEAARSLRAATCSLDTFATDALPAPVLLSSVTAFAAFGELSVEKGRKGSAEADWGKAFSQVADALSIGDAVDVVVQQHKEVLRVLSLWEENALNLKGQKFEKALQMATALAVAAEEVLIGTQVAVEEAEAAVRCCTLTHRELLSLEAPTELEGWVVGVMVGVLLSVCGLGSVLLYLGILSYTTQRPQRRSL